MTVSRDIALNILANTKKYQEEFAKIPGHTEKQAARAATKMANQLNKGQLKAAKEAEKAAQKSAKAWEKAMSTAGGVISAQLIKSLAFATTGIGQEVADLRNEIGDLSGQTDIASETLAGLRLAAKTSGSTLQELSAGLRGLPKRMGDMARGTGEAKVAFDLLEIGVTDLATGALRPANDVFRESIKKLQGMENVTQRNEFATRLFGESGVKLTQVLGNVPLDSFIDGARAFGIDVGPKAATSARIWQINSALLAGELEKTKGALTDFLGLSDGLREFTLGFIVLKGVIGGMAKTTFLLAKANAVLFSRGGLGKAKEVLDELADIWPNVTKETHRAARQMFDLQTVLIKNAIAQGEDAEATKVNTKTKEELAKASAAAAKARAQAAKEDETNARARASATAKLISIQESQRAKQLEGIPKIEFELQRQIDAINELEKVSKDHDNAEIARLQASLAAEKETADFLEAKRIREADAAAAAAALAQSKADEAKRLLDEAAANQIAANQQQVAGAMQTANTLVNTAQTLFTRQQEISTEAFKREKAKLNRLRGIRQSLKKEILNATSEEEKHALKSELVIVNAKIKGSKLIEAERKKQVRNSAAASKAAAIFQVVLSTAQAVMTAFAQFGPPPSPAGIAAAAAAGIAGGVQIGIIASEPAPQLHTGGAPQFSQSPDAGTVSMLATERMLNTRASQGLGDDGVAALNAGGGAGGPTIVQHFWRGRIVGEQVLHEIKRRGGKLRRELTRGRRQPGITTVYAGG